ncbi:MAG: NUDIX hydrolase [Chloroflexi bacterium RBG_19FT_COMBO_62_14]|nr:MAG: NUDIX hydrolase [Chloroflexi bacterium RBG_19FT_COMBO_62_14]
MSRERFKLVSAVHLFLMKDGQVLLLRRHNTGYEDGKLSVIAGHLDGGEQVKEAACREAKEEVGIDILPEEIEVVGVMHRKTTDERVDWFVAAHRWKGEPSIREPDRCRELLWIPTNEPPPDLIPYVRRSLENLRQGKWFDSFGWEA